MIKRLVKKNEFYDAKEMFGDTVEVFKNPTSSELFDIKKIDGNIRGLWYFDGVVYAWSSSNLHHNMEDEFKDLDYNQPHFFTSGRNWIKFHLAGLKIDSKQLKDAILLNKSILENMIDMDSATIVICENEMLIKDFLENKSETVALINKS